MKNKSNHLPLTLFLKRRSIRNYPGGITVGVYYCEDVDQNFAISTQKEVTAINVKEENE